MSTITPHDLENSALLLQRIRVEVGKIVVGQHYLIDRILMALMTAGHVLIEGVPGLAKTTAVKAIAWAINTQFSRVQFTPDLLPADVIGTQVFRPNTGDFTIKKGPVFTNLLLADEINRAPAKVQSALLESMQERQVTIGDNTLPLPDPFVVLATQNPIEQEGTYPLPEAQVDRFMLKLAITYPEKTEEKEIMRRMSMAGKPQVHAVCSMDEFKTMRTLVDKVYIDSKVEDYIIDLIYATRKPMNYGLEKLRNLIAYGASPRASIYLAQVAKAHAFMDRRDFITPQDVKTMAPDILRHRIMVTYEAEAQDITTDMLIRNILDAVDVP